MFLEVLNSSYIYLITSKVHFVKRLTNYIKYVLNNGYRRYREDLLHYSMGPYCYKVMPFGLKNAGATYQRVATTLLHDLMHKEVEVYVDDMIVKSKDSE